MNETTKTATIVGLGAALLVVGIYFLPSKADFTVESKVNEILFPALQDGNAAKGMEIVSFDEKLSRLNKFEIKQESNGRWVLPSHNNYPADAKQQLVNAASSLVNLKALEQIDGNPEKHELYGVLDPSKANVKVGSTGVGKLVTFIGGGSQPLAKIIIGKQHKDEGKPNAESDLRYVRIADQDPIYTVKLPTEKFSPKFEDWIETDLLKLNEFDIKGVEFRDYSVRPEDRNNPIQEKSVADLAFDDKEAQWSLKKFEEIIDGKPVEVKLNDKEELNTTKLNDLKTALNELKIVDVIRKPQGLINSLRENEIKLEPEAVISLQQSGFYLTRSPEGLKLYARDGEVITSLRDGVEYTLRFGDFADALHEASDAEDAKDKNPAAPKTGTKINRYLMVEAKFNPDLIPKPMLEEVPPGPAPAPADKKEEPAKEAAEPKPEPAKEPSKGKEPAKDGKQSSVKDSPFRTAAFQAPAKEAEKKPADKAAPEKQPVSEATIQPTEPKAAEPKADETKPSAGDDAAARAEAEFERKRIIRENENKQKEYETKVQAGQRKAKLLNERFAEWYYVIPDEVYKKIHLSKNDIIIPVKPQPGESPNPLKIPGPLQGLPPGFPPPGLMPNAK